MLNKIWAGMILISTLAGLALGRGAELSGAVFTGCSRALSLAVTLLGVAAFWSGLMHIAEQSGLLAAFAGLLRPLIRLLFPGLGRGGGAEQAIAASMTANIFGLSGAATPLGLRAMAELAKGQPRGMASPHMQMLVLINSASLQIVPATVVALRQEAGSAAPFAIMPAVWLTSAATLVAGVLLLRLLTALARPRRQRASEKGGLRRC
ncbi:MAG: spore maturation protein A [Clostridiales bacterium]|nr:spore maturation protein A [Clostridiales bacterium]